MTTDKQHRKEGSCVDMYKVSEPPHLVQTWPRTNKQHTLIFHPPGEDLLNRASNRPPE